MATSAITNNTAGLTLYFYSDSGLTQLINNPTNYINVGSPFLQTIYVKAVNENVKFLLDKGYKTKPR